jgi:hypothetical protein
MPGAARKKEERGEWIGEFWNRYLLFYAREIFDMDFLAIDNIKRGRASIRLYTI